MHLAVYKPKKGDPDHVTVGRIHFKAGEPAELDAEEARVPGYIEKLRANPWFDVEDVKAVEPPKADDSDEVDEDYTDDAGQKAKRKVKRKK